MKTTLAVVISLAALSVSSRADESTPGGSGEALAAQSSPATERFGAGIILGEPTGLSLKYFLTDIVALDGAVGWSFSGRTDLYFHGDVLWHKRDIFAVTVGEMSLYGGVGGRVKVSDHGSDRVGVRVPVGLAYHFENIPVDVFAEIAPIVDVAPSTRASLSGGIGARWWF